MNGEGEDQEGAPGPQLVLLEGEHGRMRTYARDRHPEQSARLRLIDCRPNLYEAIRCRRATIRESVERLLGRFSAFLAAKLRRERRHSNDNRR